MFEKIGYTWRVMGASWEVLKKDKELLIFPLLSTGALVLVVASFAYPLMSTDFVGDYAKSMSASEGGTVSTSREILFYFLLFIFYFLCYFVITFFNTAIAASAIKRLGGGDPTFRFGLSSAGSRLPQIVGWALLAATVGLILQIIEQRSEKVGRIISSLLGLAWSVTTFLVVPILVVERKGPIDAFKKSASLLKRTWGEQLVGHFGFGVIFFLLSLPAVALVALVAMSGKVVLIAPVLVIAVCYWIVLSLVQATLKTVFQSAVYVYATRNTVPEGFSGDMLQGAMMQKQKRGLFGRR